LPASRSWSFRRRRGEGEEREVREWEEREYRRATGRGRRREAPTCREGVSGGKGKGTKGRTHSGGSGQSSRFFRFNSLRLLDALDVELETSDTRFDRSGLIRFGGKSFSRSEREGVEVGLEEEKDQL
jgi:hypothetical protein